MNLFLRKNPFYVLEVSPYDKRTKIIANADERAFFNDADTCENARTELLNPEKRLAAELDWFFGVSDDEISAIHNAIDEGKEIHIDGLTGISKLNESLHNFEVANYSDCLEIGSDIVLIDKQYTKTDLIKLTDTINESHRSAGMRDVTVNETEFAFNAKRGRIRQIISGNIDKLSKNERVELTAMIARGYVAKKDYNDGPIISDLID